MVYKGAMDNSSIEKNVKTNFLEPALEAALKGERPAVTETTGRGCKIRYLRTKD